MADVLRQTFVYGEGDDRATGYVLTDTGWATPLGKLGPVLLDDLEVLLGVRFTIVAVQGYRNGSGTDWHADTPFDVQAILSCGATRTFSIARPDMTDRVDLRLDDGDLVSMASGFQGEWCHSIPPEPSDERCSLVFRTETRCTSR